MVRDKLDNKLQKSYNLFIMDSYGLYGPFKNPDDINQLWYQVTEKELEEYIKQVNSDLKESNSKGDVAILKQDLKRWTDELKNLRNYVDNYHRCKERYKFDNKILEQIQTDWEEYNLSLYRGYCRIQGMKLDSSQTRGDVLKAIQKESRAEEIKREEIERRLNKLLT